MQFENKTHKTNKSIIMVTNSKQQRECTLSMCNYYRKQEKILLDKTK